MRKLTRWLVRKFLPGEILIVKPVNEIVMKTLIGKYTPLCHLSHNPPKGIRKVKTVETQVA